MPIVPEPAMVAPLPTATVPLPVAEPEEFATTSVPPVTCVPPE